MRVGDRQLIEPRLQVLEGAGDLLPKVAQGQIRVVGRGALWDYPMTRDPYGMTLGEEAWRTLPGARNQGSSRKNLALPGQRGVGTALLPARKSPPGIPDRRVEMVAEAEAEEERQPGESSPNRE